LRADTLRYLVGNYPQGSLSPVGSPGIDYLVEDLPEKGIELHETLPHKSAILQAFAEPDFDILHITCHGKADPGSYDQARIILSDRRAGGKKVPVELDTTQVAAKARLDQDGSPRIVVLNACETGRQAPVLTDWGGWPRTFWDGGAAVFIRHFLGGRSVRCCGVHRGLL
jgi:hypothetical protein